MQEDLRKLERPVPGQITHGGAKTRMIGFMIGETEEQEVADTPPPAPSFFAGPEQEFVFMENSLFLLPEAFEDEQILMAALDDLNDPDAIWLPDDFPEEGEIEEAILLTILANYGQVWKYLHRKVLSRGYKQ